MFNRKHGRASRRIRPSARGRCQQRSLNARRFHRATHSCPRRTLLALLAGSGGWQPADKGNAKPADCQECGATALPTRVSIAAAKDTVAPPRRRAAAPGHRRRPSAPSASRASGQGTVLQPSAREAKDRRACPRRPTKRFGVFVPDRNGNFRRKSQRRPPAAPRASENDQQRW